MRGRILMSRFPPALLGKLWSRARLSMRLIREPSVPASLKALLFLPAIYVIAPIDLLPDLLPGLGQIDDLGVVLLALQAFLSLCPVEAVRFHRDAIGSRRPFSPMGPAETVIDAEWRRG